MMRLWIVALLAALWPLATDAFCPYRCLCFRTTVRCMFLQLEKVPEVPPETTILDLRFNKIKEIPGNTFKNLKKLNTLLLNNNHITRIEDEAFIGLKELRYLYLYKNRIRIIQSNAFKGLHKLEQLYIHFNKIEKIEPNTFSDLPALERLFLHNNKLARIPPGAFKKLHSLRRLRLDSNALICDCQMMWLSQMLKQNHAHTQAAATCEFPDSLQGKSLMAISTDDFRCKKPQLTEEPNDVDVSFGGTVYFTCKAEGDPQPDILWFHNSNEINLTEDSRYSVLSDGTLMIAQAQDLDQGVYECMAKNVAGEIKSRTAKIRYLSGKGLSSTVFPPSTSTTAPPKSKAPIRTFPRPQKIKPQFTESPADHSVPVGSTIVLPCGATGHPVPAINWTHNSEPLPQTNRHHVSPSGTLTIQEVQPSDAGAYRCVASNSVAWAASTAVISVQAPPTFLESPRDQEVIEGNGVEFTCIVTGYPTPHVSWARNGQPVDIQGRLSILNGGSILRINSVQKSDQGSYSCHAKNDGGQRNSTAVLNIKEKVPPVFSRIPVDKKVVTGSSLELLCNADGDPPPKITWKKDGVRLAVEDSHHQISAQGDLYMFSVRKQDEGTYECVAENEIGYASVSMHLKIQDDPYAGYPGDRFIETALEEAKQEVDKAVNHTLQQLFSGNNQRSPSDLLQVFRFPSQEARNIARAAEIYERALQIVWKHVESGVKFNLSDFTYEDILSPGHLQLLANLSGCLVHRPLVSCSDMCFHKKYRTYDASCNNFQNKMWGASLTPFRRILPPKYENGLNTPIGWSRTHLYNGFRKPSARLLSSQVISAPAVSQDSQYSHMLMQWGQFLDHDLDFSMPAISHASFVDGVDCRTSCEYSPPCFPIEVPPEDRRVRRYRCMEFVRSSTVCGSGLTSVFQRQVMPREQVNQLTAYIDASNVYGNTERIALHLRNLSSSHGLLRYGVLMETGKPLLPFNDGQPIDCKKDSRESDVDCFLAGDIRANEQLGLLAVHTLWMREHNRVATQLRTLNPHWDGDMLYHEARKIVGAIMQHITYSHWLPKVLGAKGTEALGPYTGYDPTVDPSIANVFATAALRFGHTLINPELLRLNSSFQPIPQGNVPLRKAFFAPFRLLEEGGIDPLMRGLFYAPAKLKQPTQILNAELTEHLFEPAHLVAQDLAALNVQRGRDHGLPSYNEWRRFCNLSTAKTFQDLQHEIRSPDVLARLQQLYGHPDNIDLWIGGVNEDSVEGAKVGPTFLCLLVDQFKRLRSGDRFWYENPGVFTPEQLTQIKQSSLGQVICDNGDNITQITKDVFLIPQVQSPQYVDCSKLPGMDLQVWTECCLECSNSGEFNSVTKLHYLTKRSAEYSYLSSRPSSLGSLNVSSNFAATGDRTTNSITDRNWREKDFDAAEQRIEGIEELVGRLEKTVQRLSRKVRKLESQCNVKRDGHCKDSNGHQWRSGDEWRQDPCTHCVCNNSQITCNYQVCPPLHCKTPTFSEDECCPVC